MAAGKVQITGTGKTEFLVRHFGVSERLGTLFNIEVDLLTLKRPPTLTDFLGQSWTLTIDLPGEKKRYFNGHVANIVSTGMIGRHASYHATLRPKLWFLSLTSNCRIYPDMSILDILQELTKKAGVMVDPSGLNDSYPEHRYVVQYRESDLNFVHRLMENEGMYYFFRHSNGQHEMVLADGAPSHATFPGYEEVPHHTSPVDVDHIDEWTYSASVQTKKYALNDYDYKKPNAEISAVLEGQPVSDDDPAQLEHYDFPGAYFDPAQGQTLVARRQQAALANAEVAFGGGNVRGLSAGFTFKLTNVRDDDHQNGEYLITDARLDCSAGDFEAMGQSGDELFRCQFSVIKADTQFRPMRVTPRPVIHGLQSAKVIGPKGKEIWTDAQGRIRIKFHWQRPESDAGREEASAIWVRVAQVMAGKSWGALQIPRIGHEVVVSFLEGDPDRPVVVGCVYNEANQPPFSPSGGGMVLGMKSDSTPGGGGYNELSFDDSKGKEKINIHGQYDMTTTIEHDQTLTVHNNRTSTIDVNDTESVGADQSITIGANQTLAVTANQTNTIGANQDTTVNASHSLTVLVNSAETIGVAKELTIGGAYQVSVGAAFNETVAGLKAEEVGAAKSVNVAANSSEDIGGSKSVSTGKNLSVKTGGDISLDADKKMALHAKADMSAKGDKKGVIEIADQLTIKVGSASITLKKNGNITIKGNKISIKGDGDVKVKGSKIGNN